MGRVGQGPGLLSEKCPLVTVVPWGGDPQVHEMGGVVEVGRRAPEPLYPSCLIGEDTACLLLGGVGPYPLCSSDSDTGTLPSPWTFCDS